MLRNPGLPQCSPLYWQVIYFRSVKVIEAKAAQDGTKSPFHKIIYENLVGDPIGEVKKMYSYFNIQFTEDTERHLKKYVENDPSKKYGVHKYSLSDFEITEERLRTEFTVYDKYMSTL